MDISGEYHLALGRQDAWRALMDPEVLRRCIPGCEELEQIEADRYRARVRLVIGPVKATFHVDLRIVEATPPESYRLEGDGRAGAIGFGQGYADVKLSESGDSTVLSYSSDFQVGGRLAQIGSRLVLVATRKIAADFFSRLAADLDGEAERVVPAQASAESSRHTQVVIAVVVMLVALLLWWLFGAQVAGQ
jgi:carbon monoxide dehydrogenase subunit G